MEGERETFIPRLQMYFCLPLNEKNGRIRMREMNFQKRKESWLMYLQHMCFAFIHRKQGEFKKKWRLQSLLLHRRSGAFQPWKSFYGSMSNLDLPFFEMFIFWGAFHTREESKTFYPNFEGITHFRFISLYFFHNYGEKANKLTRFYQIQGILEMTVNPNINHSKKFSSRKKSFIPHLKLHFRGRRGTFNFLKWKNFHSGKFENELFPSVFSKMDSDQKPQDQSARSLKFNVFKLLILREPEKGIKFVSEIEPKQKWWNEFLLFW